MAAVPEGEQDDFGRDSCALLRAMDHGGSLGMKPPNLPTACLTMPLNAFEVRILSMHVTQMTVRDRLRPKVQALLDQIKKLGDPHPRHVQSAIARHIRSSMHLESQALSEADTLALVTTGLDNTSDEAKQ